MKKYIVHYNYYAGTDVVVLANSKEEAIEKADQIDLYNEDFELEFENREIVDSKDIPDLQETIDKASTIIKEYKNDDAFKVPYYPTITTQSWDGNNYLRQRNVIEDFYWEPERGLMMDVGEGFEVALSELSETEQLEVCQVIIEAASLNGIEL